MARELRSFKPRGGPSVAKARQKAHSGRLHLIQRRMSAQGVKMLPGFAFRHDVQCAAAVNVALRHVGERREHRHQPVVARLFVQKNHQGVAAFKVNRVRVAARGQKRVHDVADGVIVFVASAA